MKIIADRKELELESKMLGTTVEELKVVSEQYDRAIIVKRGDMEITITFPIEKEKESIYVSTGSDGFKIKPLAANLIELDFNKER